MGRWELALSVDRGEREPIFVEIARAVTRDIQAGRLKPGTRMPGSRSLARSLKVHRNTALAAYAELELEGWITTQPARGTFVSAELPTAAPRGSGAKGLARAPERCGYPLSPPPEMYRAAGPRPSGLLALSGGIPDVRLVPAAELARAYRRALIRRAPEVLSYGDPQGHALLREALVEMLAATRGLPVGPQDIVVTRGSQMALFLVARALVRAGDAVAVEVPGYRPAWEAFRLAGAELAFVPVDRGGIDVDRLDALCRERPVRAVYVTPHHQYPTTATLSAARRLRLLELARRHRFAVVEDDYDHEFHYEGRPVLPLASADGAGSVVYVGTLSKVLAPGLRVGYAVGPRPLIESVLAHRSFVDLQGDHAVECAVADLLSSGEAQRHARRVRRIYQRRRDVLLDECRRRLSGVLEWRTPSGGMAVWAKVDPAVALDRWEARARERGVLMQTGRRFSQRGKLLQAVRLGFAALDETLLAEAVHRLALALPPMAWPRKRPSP